jgi:CheY-like chemotaxis protein
MPRKPVLYVEDEDSDVFLMRLAFEKAHIEVPLHAVKDGEVALDYLRGTGDFANREEHPFPGLVLLDLNIPRIHGFKVLEWIRGQPEFAALPVVVYTSSDQPRDVHTARQLGANGYAVKPASIEGIAEKVKELIHRWLG